MIFFGLLVLLFLAGSIAVRQNSGYVPKEPKTSNTDHPTDQVGKTIANGATLSVHAGPKRSQ